MNRLTRLVTMDPREIAYRVHEKLRCESDRVRHYVGVQTAPDDVFFDNFKTYLIEKAEARFYFRATGPERDRHLQTIRHAFPEWMDQAVDNADRSCRHQVQLLGCGELDLGAVIDWHRDPVTGKSWPRRFWSEYDLVNEPGPGDPKLIHELNRHQHIVGLAKAYFLTGDERYSQEAVSQLESWIGQNPTSMGVNWQSSLEIAIRATSWIWTLFLLLPSRSLTDQAASRIGRSLFAQIDHIDRFPSLFSSPNTHLIGEATALFVSGTIFQGTQQAAHWQRRGTDWLTREMELQVTSDGVHGELSSYYHCYTVDFLLQAMTLSKLNGCEFPEWMFKRLDRMMEYVVQISRNDGTLPLLGDDDGGRALAIVSRDYRSARFDEERFWLLGNDGSDQLSSAPLEASAYYPAAGYAIQRSGWGLQDSQVIFDFGGLGILNGGHGHADALSLVVNVGGTEILADPGTCVYNGAPEWRNFFRSTRAHNTVVVDETDQSIPAGTFKWQKRAQCRVVRHQVQDTFEYLESEHDGYCDAPIHITHRRALLHVRPDIWVVVDNLLGPASEHIFDSYFHFAANARVSVSPANDTGLRVSARADRACLQLFMCASSPVEATTMDGQLDPIQGWVSSGYGEKAKAPTLKLRMHSHAPASSMFIVLPSHSETGAEQQMVLSSIDVKEGTAIASQAIHGEVTDIFVSSLKDEVVLMPDFTLRGRFFWLRQTKGQLTNVFGIACKEVRHRNEVLLCDNIGKPHFVHRSEPS